MSVVRSLIRRAIPRSVRNAVRRPRTTLQRLTAKGKFMFGHAETIPISSDWSVRCHPICVPEFTKFRTERSQRSEMESFISYCQPGMRLMDVGAHWGIFTLAALHYGGSSATALCVEASGAAGEILKTNARLNGVATRARVVEIAAGADCGSLEMLTTGAGGADYFIASHESRPDVIRVKQAAISDICDEYAFRPTHLKIDVEGYEEEVLVGAELCLRRCVPVIFLELHGSLIRERGKRPESIVTFLEQLGYDHWEEGGSKITQNQLERRGFEARLVCLSSR